MNKNTRRKSPLFGMVTAAALSLLLVGPAMATESVTTATVTGGSLALTGGGVATTFVSKAVTGVSQTTTAALAAYSVADLRGTGAGWHVTAVATRFTTGTVPLAVGSLTTADWTVLSPDTESADPTGIGGKVLDNGVVKIASAGLDAGMGTYNFSANTLTLTLPADVKVGAYASTVTIDAVTAP